LERRTDDHGHVAASGLDTPYVFRLKEWKNYPSKVNEHVERTSRNGTNATHRVVRMLHHYTGVPCNKETATTRWRHFVLQTTVFVLLHRIFTCFFFDSFLVARLVTTPKFNGRRLRGRIRIRGIEQVLNAHEDLLDHDRGPPALFFIQDGKTDSPRRINIWMKQRGSELAWN
jgi:hypothetical protein